MRKIIGIVIIWKVIIYKKAIKGIIKKMKI